MTHLQTAEVSGNPFLPKTFGPDYDDVISLDSAPVRLVKNPEDQENMFEPILGDALLRAGVIVSVPEIPLQLIDDNFPAHYPYPDLWKKEQPVTVMYRGIGPLFTVNPKHVYLLTSAICNSPERDPFPDEPPYWTEMPKRFLMNTN